MSDQSPKTNPRSRFNNVVNARDVEAEPYWRETASYGGSARELAVALGTPLTTRAGEVPQELSIGVQ